MNDSSLLAVIERFLARYEAALSSGDVADIATCYDPPSLLVTDTATTPLSDRAQVEAYFTGIAGRYRALGAFSGRATVRRVEKQTAALYLLNVRWDSFDESGTTLPGQTETYQYLIRLREPDDPLIVLVIVTS